MTRRAAPAWALALVLLPVAGGCGDSSGPEASVVGYYPLVSASWVGEPILGRPSIVDGAVTLLSNGTGSWAQTERDTWPPFVSHFYSESGSYTRKGNEVSLALPQRTMLLMFSDGNTLTATEGPPGHVFVYRR